MQRNTQTTVKELKIGDRFYKLKDRNKTVLQMVRGSQKVTKYRTYNHWCKADNEKYPQAIDKNTVVIFLRNAYDKATQ